MHAVPLHPLLDSPTGVYELLGPAGAGKSTLLADWRRRDPAVRGDLSLWRLPRHVQFRGFCAVLPTAIGTLLEGRPLWPSELGHMIRIEALERRLRTEQQRGATLIVLDEGPLFGLAWIRVFHGSRGGRRRAAWRRSVLQRWAPLLSGIVSIDATDAVLAHRIRTRGKPHPLKRATAGELRRFSEAFRLAFAEVCADLREIRPIPVARFR